VSLDFLGKTAITGVGYTAFMKRSERTVLSLAAEACRAALDGIASYSLFNDSVACQAVASSLAVPELTWACDLNAGGVAPSLAVMNAAMAVASGVAEVVLVFRALNGRSGVRIGQQRFSAPTAQYRYPIGYTAYPQYMAMLARRFMIDTGATEEDLASVVIGQRETAALNERAIRRELLTHDEYFAAPWVVEPFRSVDCTSEVDGACALVVTSTGRARTLRQPAIRIVGAAWATGFGSGLDIADLHLWPDYSRICQDALADRLWRSSGLRPQDVDLAEIYDCFSSTVLFGLEALGLVERGGAGEFIRSGEASLTGSLPVNTHGGLLCEGYVHGMNTVTEGVLQLQHRGGNRQVDGAATGVVTSGAMGDGSALILMRDDAA
jgi:acetyl-CoA acetyltransferase